MASPSTPAGIEPLNRTSNSRAGSAVGLEGQVDGLRPSDRDDHVGRPRSQHALSRSETVRDALRPQTSLLHGPIRELHSDVVIGHAVKTEGLHPHDHGLLLTQHRCQLIPRLPGQRDDP